MDGFGIWQFPPQTIGSKKVAWISRFRRSGPIRNQKRAATGVGVLGTGGSHALNAACFPTPGGHPKGAGARSWQGGSHRWIGE
jgi:hypothetical protein